MACDVVRVRLHLRRVRVLGVLADAPDVLRVGVESASRRLRCPHCGFKCHRVHDTRDKQVRDLEVSGRRTTLVWVRRRFRRDNCGSRFLEEHPGFGGGLTRRLARRLVADAQVMTIRAATRRHGVSRPVIDALVRACSGLVAEHRRSRRCRVLLVDETSMRKRHRHVTVIVNGDTGRTLAMVEHRSSAALTAFLMSQSHKWRRGAKVVVTDGSRAYKASVEACLPSARHVLDRFHVIRWFAAGLAAARRDIQRREPHGVKPAIDPEVCRARFLQMRRADQLDDSDQARLDAPRRFRDLHETAEPPESHDIVDTIIAWSTQILALHHTDRASNGRIDGANNLPQVPRRTTHGFTNPHNLAARGILVT